MIHTLDDFIDNSISSLLANIVDNDIRAKFAVHESVRASQSGTSTGDDGGLPVEADGR